MKKCEIYFSENDEFLEDIVIEKCWRGDIIVKIDNELFSATAITPERILGEFNNAINDGEIYAIDNNLILVENTKRDTIIATIVALAKNDYFSNTKPIDLKKEYANYCQELQELKNWVQVY